MCKIKELEMTFIDEEKKNTKTQMINDQESKTTNMLIGLYMHAVLIPL